MQKTFLLIYAVAGLSSFFEFGESKLINLQEDLIPKRLQDVGISVNKQDVKFAIHKLAKNNEYKLPQDSKRKPVGLKTPVVGSDGLVYTDTRYDKGLFSTILNAYANHWVLETTPEDWWFTIIRKVTLDIDAYSDNPKVRQFFVNHEGQKELKVVLGSNVYGANYSSFFDQMTDQIGENINNPEYVNIINSDFSTSSKIHKIVSNIAIMSSVQNYFSYTGSILCGIPKVEMKGYEKDWVKLKTKFESLGKYLQSIKHLIGQREWWPKARIVLEKLLDTYKGNPDQNWWAKIVSKPGSAGCGGPQTFNGWFVKDFLSEQPDDLPSGLISVPMKITDDNIDEQSALVAGIPGVMIEEGYNLYNDTMIRAVHAWALMLEPDSVFRNDLDNLERNNEIY